MSSVGSVDCFTIMSLASKVHFLRVFFSVFSVVISNLESSVEVAISPMFYCF